MDHVRRCCLSQKPREGDLRRVYAATMIGVGRTCLKVFGPVAVEPHDVSAAEDP